MPRYRSRSRSYSPRRRSRTPPRSRKHYDDDRRWQSRSYRDRRTPLPSGLLIRNLPLDARPEDLRVPFERYGPVKDVYLPKNYYTGEPRGFGFVKFRYGEDAAEAKQELNHTIIGGREIRIVFAEENRKTPQEMQKITRVSGRSSRRSPTRSSRSPRSRSYSRSLSPARRDSRDRKGKDVYQSPERSRSLSRSASPHYENNDRRSPSPRKDRHSHDKLDHTPSRLPTLRDNGHSGDKRDRSASRSPSPRGNGRSPSGSRSRSYSPCRKPQGMVLFFVAVC